VEAADPERMIPNPTKKQMQKELRRLCTIT
jgi:hypothetical protein